MCLVFKENYKNIICFQKIYHLFLILPQHQLKRQICLDLLSFLQISLSLSQEFSFTESFSLSFFGSLSFSHNEEDGGWWWTKMDTVVMKKNNDVDSGGQKRNRLDEKHCGRECDSG